MALDVYLQMEGIKGESADSGHAGWIELTSAFWGVTQPKSATASTSGGHTAERCEHRTLAVTKLADLASPLLMMYSSMGKTIPKAKLEFMRADGNGVPVRYYEIELENVLVTSVDQSIHSGSTIQDAIGLRFSKVKWRYTQQKIVGGILGQYRGRMGSGNEPLRLGLAMSGFQPKDSRGYFMLPQAPEDAGYYVYGNLHNVPGTGA